MITVRVELELIKTGSFVHKNTKQDFATGDEFRYIAKFRYVAKILYIAKISLF